MTRDGAQGAAARKQVIVWPGACMSADDFQS